MNCISPDPYLEWTKRFWAKDVFLFANGKRSLVYIEAEVWLRVMAGETFELIASRIDRAPKTVKCLFIKADRKIQSIFCVGVEALQTKKAEFKKKNI